MTEDEERNIRLVAAQEWPPTGKGELLNALTAVLAELDADRASRDFNHEAAKAALDQRDSLAAELRRAENNTAEAMRIATNHAKESAALASAFAWSQNMSSNGEVASLVGMLDDAKAERDAAVIALRLVDEWWTENWDCSRSPGHDGYPAMMVAAALQRTRDVPVEPEPSAPPLGSTATTVVTLSPQDSPGEVR